MFFFFANDIVVEQKLEKLTFLLSRGISYVVAENSEVRVLPFAIPDYVYAIWKTASSSRELKGHKFETVINNQSVKLGFEPLTCNVQGKNYIKGASGVSHEIDVCSINPETKELLLVECKTGRLVRYTDVSKFIVKTDDVVEQLKVKHAFQKTTKILVALHDIDPNGYMMCWYYGIIPIQCSEHKLPVFIAPYIIQELASEIEANPYPTEKTRQTLLTRATTISDEINSFFAEIRRSERYKIRIEKEMRSKVEDHIRNLEETLSTLNQLADLGYDVSSYLVNLLFHGKIQEREDFNKVKKDLLTKYRLNKARIDNYVILSALMKKACDKDRLVKIFPVETACCNIARKIAKRNIGSKDEFRSELRIVRKECGKRIGYYDVLRATFTVLPDDEIRSVIRYYAEDLRFPTEKLRYSISRYILKQLASRAILSKKDLDQYLNRENSLLQFPIPLVHDDLVRYAKYHELKKILTQFFPFKVASRSVADLIALGKIRSLKDVEVIRTEVADIYWLEERPSFESIISLSPLTKVCVRFFGHFGKHIRPTIYLHHPELLSVDDDLIGLIEALQLRRVAKAKICEACGREISARIISIMGKPLVVCDKCSKLLHTYSSAEEKEVGAGDGI